MQKKKYLIIYHVKHLYQSSVFTYLKSSHK